jgi:hypothetical protein
VGEGANRPKAQRHPDLTGVYAADRWSESHASYPGRSFALLETARVVERRRDGAGEVSNGQSSLAEPDEGPNVRNRPHDEFEGRSRRRKEG